MDSGDRAFETPKRALTPEDSIDPDFGSLSDFSKEKGMNVLDSAQNCMIDNFRTTKWFYLELEEIKRKIGQKESIKDATGFGHQADYEERAYLVEKRIQDFESANHNLAINLISILNSMNDNI